MGNDDIVLKEIQFSKPPFVFQYNSWYATVLSLLLWAAFYQLVIFALGNHRSKEYCCRVLSFVHGLITGFVGINECFLIDTPFYHPEWRTTESQRFLMVFSLGYFIHDLVWLLIYDRSSKVMLAHHIYSVFALRRMLYKETGGASAICTLGSMEISNPLLQIRWFLRSEGFYPSNLYASVEITFVIVFFFVRIVLGTYFLMMIVYELKNDLDFTIMALPIYIISWIFFINITKYLIAKYGLDYEGLDIQNRGR